MEYLLSKTKESALFKIGKLLKVIFVVNYLINCFKRVTNWMLFLFYVNSQSDEKEKVYRAIKSI